MFAQISHLKSPTGAELAVRYARALGQPRGLLLLVHGLVEHSARYQRFAAFMAQQGFHVYAHDQRGHGATMAVDAPFGQFAAKDGARLVLDDLRAVRTLAGETHPGLPVIVFGHSMGGLVVLNAAERDAALYDGVAIWNSNFHPGLAGRAGQVILGFEKMLKGSDTPSAVLPKLTFDEWAKSVSNRKTAFDWLSRDPTEVAAYIADPLCGFDVSISLWIDMLTLAFDGARPDRLRRLAADLPIHLLGGGQDPATANGREILWLAARMKAAGLTAVTSTVIDGMRHETLNEIGREAAMTAFATWCTAVADRHERRAGR